jgi:hypothetical protein
LFENNKDLRIKEFHDEFENGASIFRNFRKKLKGYFDLLENQDKIFNLSKEEFNKFILLFNDLANECSEVAALARSHKIEGLRVLGEEGKHLSSIKNELNNVIGEISKSYEEYNKPSSDEEYKNEDIESKISSKMFYKNKIIKNRIITNATAVKYANVELPNDEDLLELLQTLSSEFAEELISNLSSY